MTPPRTETFPVEQSRPAARLDIFLREKFPDVSRGTIQRLIADGHILVNGQPAKPTHAPRVGDSISVHWPEARPAAAQPQEIPLEILFEDKHLLVLNKPPGIVVHPSAGHDQDTVVNALLHHCAGQLSGIGGVARPGIVHRLDRDTSGCLVVAKTDAAHLKLAEQFAGRSVAKIYHALLCGALSPASGEIHAPIARHPVHRKRMAVVPPGKGRDAWTSYAVKEKFPAATFVQAALHTGRTHQIRVHFAHLGFPVVGDSTYGVKQNKKFVSETGVRAPRQLLHASQIEFAHPQNGKAVKCAAPLPQDFCAALAALRA